MPSTFAISDPAYCFGIRFRLWCAVRRRCCYLLEEPFVVPDPTASESNNVSGLAITYLGLLERRLGFTCSLRPYEPIAPEYKGFSGFVNRFADCGSETGESTDCEW